MSAVPPMPPKAAQEADMEVRRWTRIASIPSFERLLLRRRPRYRTEHSKRNFSGMLLLPLADRQASVGKGEVEIPAREMLADMLLLGGRPAAALERYRQSLASDPNRFNALLGAGPAAEKLAGTAWLQGTIVGCSRILSMPLEQRSGNSSTPRRYPDSGVTEGFFAAQMNQ